MTKESFSQMFEESLKKIEIRPGFIVRATILNIKKDIVIVDAGLKSESSIPIEQFKNLKGELEISLGDKVDVTLEAVEDGFGETLLSREKAKRHESWKILEHSHNNSENIIGIINGKVKGGFTVELNGIRAFLPGSLIDVRPIRDTSYLEGKELEFKVIKLDKKRNNVVVSRRAVIESEYNIERNNLLENLQEGIIVNGIVKNLTDYGAFIDLGGVDGLLHITDMAWKRVKHPSEIVNISDEINVKILKFDRERTRVSLGLKQLSEDPWISISNRYKEKNKLTGRVTNLTDYGCFVEIEEGVEGLVHVSEMDWTNKNIHPSKVVSVGDKVNIIILEINEERRRISLGIKQCTPNPWKGFSKIYNKGDKVLGKIKSITEFGIFVGLSSGIDGLVHISDLSWNSSGEEDIKKYVKGNDIETILLQVDSDRERISLGIKQLTEDPLNYYISFNKKNPIIEGNIDSIKEKFVIINLLNGIKGRINITEFKDIIPIIGNIIKTKLISIDKKNRIVFLELYKKNKINKILKNNLNKDKKQKKSSNIMKVAFQAATKNE
ncbi:30S ribosomal protein S1 [Sodalis-like secondary symbiont of Drepanosiphum platanoidis]|uniref:30S ribosomal protein S1 n=1 Tax=Sodalis-like secondary symbiont of Drepanosiphum platanoidis TaxID=2994493 RepID=UPI0034640227